MNNIIKHKKIIVVVLLALVLFVLLLESINIGNGQFEVTSVGNVTCKNLTATVGGKIGCFDIDSTKLYSGDSARLSDNIISCGSAGNGLAGFKGNNGGAYVQVGSSGSFPDGTCIDGVKIYYNGVVRHYDGDGNVDWQVNLRDIP